MKENRCRNRKSLNYAVK